MSKLYVDNEKNRRLGRVGMPHGSMPEHMNRRDANVGQEQPPKHRSSSDTYVDNGANRKLERVGLPKGSAVVSKNNKNGKKCANRNTSPRNCTEQGLQTAQGGASRDIYVDNAYNRKLGRVGLPKGSAVVSKNNKDGKNCANRNTSPRNCTEHRTETAQDDSSPDTYVDNAYNRKLGRVGLPKGSAVVSKIKRDESNDMFNSAGQSGFATDVEHPQFHSWKSKQENSRNTSPEIKKHEVNYQRGTPDSFFNDSEPIHQSRALQSDHDKNLSAYFEPDTAARRKVYVDNAQNRKLGRVGMYHGDAIVCKDSKTNHVPATHVKLYVDSPTNRSLGRVGLPVGTAVFSSKNKCVMQKTYDDSSLNRKLGRVGKPCGSLPVKKKSKTTAKIPEMLKKIEVGDKFSEYRFEDRGSVSRDLGLAMLDSHGDRVEAYDQAIYRHNRIQEEISWGKSTPTKGPPKTQFDILKDYKGKKIPYNELKLRRIIGSGGFGRVYFAKWQKTVVAVKKLQNEKISESRIKDFSVEMLRYCKLDHPNIVKFIGACVEKPNLCIVMEYMQTTLYDALHLKDDNFNFNEDETIDIINQISAGMEYLHENRIAHCDLKTSNILMDYVQDEICEVKITDFGLSMIIHDTTVSVEELVRNIGTPQYSPPEMLRGDILSAKDMMKADVYSLAIVFLEVIFKDEPFPDYTLQQLKTEVGMEGKVPEVPSSPDIDKSIKDIMNRAWSYIPQERPTVSEIGITVRSCESLYNE